MTMAKSGYRPPSGGKALPPVPATGAIKPGAPVMGGAHKSTMPAGFGARMKGAC